MELLLKSKNWPLQLMIIVIIISVINFIIVLIGINIFSLIISQVINLTGFLFLLLYALSNINIQSYLKNKFLLTDVLLIVLLFILSKISIGILMKSEFLKIFNIDLFNNSRSWNGHPTDLQSIFLISIFIAAISVGVIAEEVYFRCYLFDIQYLQFGKYTWIINGISWSFYHIFSPQNFIVILPQCLMYSYIYQRRRNIWITLIVHLLNNYLGIFSIIKTYFTH